MIRTLLATLALFVSAAPNARPVFRYLMVGPHRIQFDAASNGAAALSNVRRVLGAKADTAEDTGPIPTACYILSGPTPHMVLAFYGDPMGTGGLSDFDLAPASRKPELTGRCVRLDVSPRQIVTDRGVKLGMARDEVEELIGTSKRAIDGQPIYEVTEERRTTLADGTIATEEISSSITVTYRNRIVVAFSGGMSESD
jgi:hypothetical protein